MEENDIKVSACIITYNQEKFISQCIEGALIQLINHNYEIVIADDCSTDATLQICQQYKEKFPGRIRLITRSKNVGMAKNWLLTMQACKGKYIAICEGDDYWTDPYKLQKQVDFLETNPGYAICYHRINILNNGHPEEEPLNTSNEPQTYTIADLAKGNIMYTPSVVFRNGLIEQFPSWFLRAPVSDYVLHMLNAKKGKIYYMPEVMAVYRIHAGGVWSTKDETYILKNIEVYVGLLIKEFNGEIKKILVNRYSEVCWRLVNEKKYHRARYIRKLARVNLRYLLIKLKLKYIR